MRENQLFLALLRKLEDGLSLPQDMTPPVICPIPRPQNQSPNRGGCSEVVYHIPKSPFMVVHETSMKSAHVRVVVIPVIIVRHGESEA